MIKGSLGRINIRKIRGWMFDTESPATILSVSLFIDGKMVSTQKADILRLDLKQVVHPTGCCGFNFELPKDLLYHGQKIEVRAGEFLVESHLKFLLGENNKQAINQFHIYGERASGTNFLKQLVLLNIPNLQHNKNNFGWKHFFPPEEFLNADKCLFLVIYRDPFDWIRSLYLQPHHVHQSLKGLSFSKFIRKEWYCIYNEEAGIGPGNELYGKEMMFERDFMSGKRFQNILQLRAAKIKAFQDLKNKLINIEFINYELIKEDPEAFIQKIVNKYDLAKQLSFIPVNTYKGITDEKFVPKSYLQLSKTDYKFIIEGLNLNLESEIGYKIRKDVVEKNGIKLWLIKLITKILSYLKNWTNLRRTN